MYSQSPSAWKRMCLGKKRMSEDIARRVAKKWGQRAYSCPHCFGWHCTKLPERMDQPK